MSDASILIVEDENIVALDIQNTLERNGLTVAAQTDRGDVAVKQAAALRPDLVLMDIHLKGDLDGVEAAIQIRSQLNLPVIFLTAYGNPTIVNRARLAEPFAYIFKPFDERELISNIRMALYKHEMDKKLRESEEKFRRVIENSTDGILIVNQKGNIVEWNAAAEHLSGLMREEVIGQPMWRTILRMMPREKQTAAFGASLETRWIELTDRAYSGTLDRMREIEIETPNRARRVIQTSGFAIQTASETLAGAIMRDVTEQRRAQEAVLNNERRFRALIENGRDNISLLAADGSLLWESPSVYQTLGYAPDQFVGRNIFELMHPDDLEATRASFAQVVQTPGFSQEGVFRLLRGDNPWRWIEATATNLLHEPTVQAVIINYRDVSERVQTENELRKVSEAVKQSANTVVITDTEGRIEYANPKFVEVTGYSLEEVLGKTPRLLKSGEHSPEFYQTMWQTILSGRVWRGEIHNRRKDGTLFWEDSTISPVFDLSNRLVNFIAVKEDITARKFLEESERDQRRLAEALRDTSAALNGTLKLEDVLDRVLENIGKLVKFDGAMVLLVEGYAVRKIRQAGRLTQPLASVTSTGNTQANLINLPILREMRETRSPCIVPDTLRDPRWQALPGMGWIRSFISTPIVIRGSVAGIITILSATPGFFNAEHAERLTVFSNQSAVAIENAQLFEQAYVLSVTDPLTELTNRRHFFEFARFEFERAQRYNRNLSVMMADIDHFKTINDLHGHMLGDMALREVANRMKHSVRASDILARYGGEEFIVLMPETSLGEAVQVAERVRRHVAGQPLQEEPVSIHATLSIGVAEMNDTCANVDGLIMLADQALYAAKSAGRNRVSHYG